MAVPPYYSLDLDEQAIVFLWHALPTEPATAAIDSSAVLRSVGEGEDQEGKKEVGEVELSMERHKMYVRGKNCFRINYSENPSSRI